MSQVGSALPADTVAPRTLEYNLADLHVMSTRFARGRDEHGAAPGLAIFDTTAAQSGINTRLILNAAPAAAELQRAKGWFVTIRYKPLARFGVTN